MADRGRALRPAGEKKRKETAKNKKKKTEKRLPTRKVGCAGFLDFFFLFGRVDVSLYLWVSTSENGKFWDFEQEIPRICTKCVR